MIWHLGFIKLLSTTITQAGTNPALRLKCFINQDAFEELPADLQAIVMNACRVANQDMAA